MAYAQERGSSARRSASSRTRASGSPRMATEIEAARQLMYYVCDEIDQKRRCDKEAAMVKFFASEMAERVTSEALQIFGGAGYTTLHAVERYWRDARLTKIFEGTSEIQQRIISDHLLGKPKQARSYALAGGSAFRGARARTPQKEQERATSPWRSPPRGGKCGDDG